MTIVVVNIFGEEKEIEFDTFVEAWDYTKGNSFVKEVR